MEKVTTQILEYFKNLSVIPRTSGNEQAIHAYMVDWAKGNKLEVKEDKTGNVCIVIPATKGMENRPGYVLQGHMDMVGQKTKESTFDFLTDTILTKIEGDYLVPNQPTTLGADNGIAIAMMQYIALNMPSHPALELLLTVDEEMGLTGAQELQLGFINNKLLLNLDSEEDDTITIGCAGSTTARITKTYEIENRSINMFKVSIRGGVGGHSGADIHKNIANCIKLVTHYLLSLSDDTLQIASINGGTVRNGIPTDCEAIFTYSKSFKDVEKTLAEFKDNVKGQYGDMEKNIKVEITQSDGEYTLFSNKDTKEILNLLNTIPHGVLGMSFDVEGLVETSNNLAIIDIKDGKLDIIGMLRSSVYDRIKETERIYTSIAELLKGELEFSERSVPWKPDIKSQLLKTSKEAYKKLYGKYPNIGAIHAGLECGVIGDKYVGMDMVSIGPNVSGCHTPDEKLHIPSIKKVYDWIQEIINS